jgi:Zn-finger nucleic acid-binding protein
MNFTTVVVQKGVAMELKYCERCGGLWLRRLGQDVVYCGGCQGQIVALLRAQQRGPKRAQAGNQAQIECLHGVAAMEVRP